MTGEEADNCSDRDRPMHARDTDLDGEGVIAGRVPMAREDYGVGGADTNAEARDKESVAPAPDNRIYRRKEDSLHTLKMWHIGTIVGIVVLVIIIGGCYLLGAANG